MSLRLFARQLGILVLSLGVLLSGAAQSRALLCFGATASGSKQTFASMPAKADMSDHCASMAMKQQPHQKTPMKCLDCAACAACSISGDAMCVDMIVAHVRDAPVKPLAPDGIQSGLVERPALPPPIILV